MILSPPTLAAIREHAARSYPFEACGFVLGSLGPQGVAFGPETLEARNSRDREKSRRRFSVEPEEFLAAEAEAERRGLGIVAIYHSHPDHPAIPSENDLGKALPYYRYLIVSVAKGEPADTSCWLLAGDRSRFLAEEITLSQD
jgi:proteasome lid subunit RPN8/RPN11